MATITGTNSRGGIARTGGSTPVSTSSSSSLQSTLASTISKANALGINTGQATSVLNQDKVAPGVAYQGSSQQAAYRASTPAITPASLTTPPVAVMPTPVVTQAPDVGAMNAGVTGGKTGLTNTPAGITIDPIVQQSLDSGKTTFDSYMASLNKADSERQTAAQVQAKVTADSHQQQYQQSVNDYTSQLNTIVANRDATNLSLTGQGRGITEAIIGGQQAQVSKEAAIKALPLQALLANAQGNLDMANQYINTWGKILMDDANNKYNHSVAKVTAVYDFANAQDKTKLDYLLVKQKETKDTATALATAKANAIKLALGQGASGAVVSAITAATDLTGVATATGKYNGDLLGDAAKRASINASNASAASSAANTKKTYYDMGVNPNGTPLSSAGSKQGTQTAFLLEQANNAIVTSSAAGTSPIKNFMQGLSTSATPQKQLANLTDTLRTNILTMQTDPAIKKFFGPQMSNTDVKLMSSSGSTLDAYSQTPAQYKAEAVRIRDLAAKADFFVQTGQNIPVNVTIVDPSTGKGESGTISQQAARQAVADGLHVTYQGADITFQN